MVTILEQLHQDHINYSRLLDLFEEDLKKMQNNESPDYLEMSRIMEYMTRYPDVFHHPYEEIIFDRMQGRLADKSAVIEKLCSEHADLADIGSELVNDLKGITSGSISSKSRFEELAHRYLALHRSHMDLEETEVFPVIKETITEADWEQMKDRLEHVRDPIFGSVVEAEFRDLYNRIIG